MRAIVGILGAVILFGGYAVGSVNRDKGQIAACGVIGAAMMLIAMPKPVRRLAIGAAILLCIGVPIWAAWAGYL